MKCLKEKVGFIKKVEMQKSRIEYRNVLQKQWEDSSYQEKLLARTNPPKNFVEFEEMEWNDKMERNNVQFYRILNHS